MSARSVVADEIRAGLDGLKVRRKAKFSVIPNPVNKLPVIEPDRALVIVTRDNFGPFNGDLSRQRTVMSVWVCVPGLDLDTVEDALDLATDEVLAVLDGSRNWIRGDATRSLYADTTHAYKIEITTILH